MTALDTMTTPAPVRTVPDRIARVLLAVASVVALASALLAAGEVASADGATKMALTFDGTGAVLVGDGIVSALLVAAYVLTRGWSRAGTPDERG